LPFYYVPCTAAIASFSSLIAAAIYAATTHKLVIWYVVLSCTGGAAVGGIAAYWIGRSVGTWALMRYGKHVGLTERRMMIAEYVFRRHGVLIIFFGRFVAVARSIAALLAGANHMQWMEFVIVNCVGAVVWSALYGFTAFYFTNEVKKLSGPVGLGVGIFAAVLVVLGFITNRMNVSITGFEGSTGVRYFPKWSELAVTGMIIAIGFAAFGLAVKYLPIFPKEELEAARETEVEAAVPVDAAVFEHAGD